uniref:Bifunctional inhibitor/plant lipid transfer protein/seed storage helical domain-containing protein n=1 Tax=Gadus morhua TaxID=8049 RepID=A0A8C5FI99_GADMO
MTTCGTVTKSMLLLAVVVALTGQGSAVTHKLSECCERVTRKQITETIVDYMVQEKKPSLCQCHHVSDQPYGMNVFCKRNISSFERPLGCVSSLKLAC